MASQTPKPSRKSRVIAGAMSGTSADGIDVAIVRVDGHGLAMSPHLLKHHHAPYDPAVRKTLFALREGLPTSVATMAQLARDISLSYARAINEALQSVQMGAHQLAAIAAHGQTIYHEPPNTMQLLDPALL